MAYYIHQYKNWTAFEWDNDELIQVLGEVRNQQGKLVGKLEILGFDLKEEANLMTLTEDVIKTSEIEGEILDFLVRGAFHHLLSFNLGILISVFNSIS